MVNQQNTRKLSCLNIRIIIIIIIKRSVRKVLGFPFA